MKITKIYIEKFRGFHDQEFEPGSLITSIAGQNGIQKSLVCLYVPIAFYSQGATSIQARSNFR